MNAGEVARWAARQKWPRRTAKAEKVEAALKQYVGWLEKESGYGPKIVMLFGSYADGTFRMNSDVDLLVVASGLPTSWGKRRVSLEDHRQTDFPAKLQTFPYTPLEFLDMCKQDNGIAYSALTEGQVLYIDDEYREELLKAF